LASDDVGESKLDWRWIVGIATAVVAALAAAAFVIPKSGANLVNTSEESDE
jgi:preprotein translocase subunit Sec61beta